MLALFFMNLWIYECIFESTALSHAQQDTLWLQQHVSSEPSGSHTRRVKSRATRQWGYCNHFLCYYLGKNLKDFPVFFPYVNKIAAGSGSQHRDEYAEGFCSAAGRCALFISQLPRSFVSTVLLPDSHTPWILSAVSASCREDFVYIHACPCDTELPRAACVITCALTFSLRWLWSDWKIFVADLLYMQSRFWAAW